MAGKDIQWIIDRGGQRMGPMETLQVVEALVARKLSVRNRVSSDGKTFVAICNEEYFEEFIQKLIEKLTPLADKETALQSLEGENSDFSELSGVHRIDVKTLGITEQLEHAKQLQRASNDLSTLRKILIDIRTNRKIVIRELRNESKVEELHPDDRDVYISEKASLNPLVGGNKYLLGLVILVAAVFVGRDIQNRRQMMAEQEEMLKKKEDAIAKEYLGGGVGSAANANEKTDVMLMDAVKSLLAISKESKGVERYLDLDGFVKNSNSAVVNGQTVNKREATNLFSSLVDRATQRILEDDNVKAEELLLTALKLPFQPKEDVLVLLVNVSQKLDNASGSGLTSKRQIRVQSVLKLTESYEKVLRTGNAKLKFVKFLSHHYLGSKAGVGTSFREFVSLFPEQRSDSITGFRGLTSWETLLVDCVNVYKSDSSNPWANAMLTGCLLRTEKKASAVSYARYAWSKLRHVEDVVVLSAQAAMLGGETKLSEEILWSTVKVSQSRAAKRTQLQKQFCASNPEAMSCGARATASMPSAIRKVIEKQRAKKQKK